MGFARRRQPRPQSHNKPEFQTSFVTHTHCLVRMGYERLDVRSFADRQEEEITGELTRAMQSALQDPRSPRWAKNFWVHEETRVHGHGRLGKRRFRIDIEIMRHGLAERPRFRFEANVCMTPAAEARTSAMTARAATSMGGMRAMTRSQACLDMCKKGRSRPTASRSPRHSKPIGKPTASPSEGSGLNSKS